MYSSCPKYSRGCRYCGEVQSITLRYRRRSVSLGCLVDVDSRTRNKSPSGINHTDQFPLSFLPPSSRLCWVRLEAWKGQKNGGYNLVLL
jgi:hypothetical protein